MFRLFCLTVFCLALSGCTGFHQMITGASNKNAGTIAQQGTVKESIPTSQCHNWCHNGWCSTHCEPINQ